MRAERLPRKELDQLAARIVRGEICIANTGEPLKHSFGHLLMMAPPVSEEDAATIGAIYEEKAKAAPTAINGHPFFFSCQFLHVDDLKPLQKRIAKNERALSGEGFFKRILRSLGFSEAPTTASGS